MTKTFFWKSVQAVNVRSCNKMLTHMFMPRARVQMGESSQKLQSTKINIFCKYLLSKSSDLYEIWKSLHTNELPQQCSWRFVHKYAPTRRTHVRTKKHVCTGLCLFESDKNLMPKIFLIQKKFLVQNILMLKKFGPKTFWLYVHNM